MAYELLRKIVVAKIQSPYFSAIFATIATKLDEYLCISVYISRSCLALLKNLL